MDTTKKKQENKIPSALTVYLGDKATSTRRIAVLDNIARSLGMSRSALIAAIGDQRLLVIPNPTAPKPEDSNTA